MLLIYKSGVFFSFSYFIKIDHSELILSLFIFNMMV